MKALSNQLQARKRFWSWDLTVQAPKASENFRCLCTCEKGLGKASKKALHYKV